MKDEEKDRPKAPVLRLDEDEIWEDYYCPSCGAFLEYAAIGKRRFERGTESRCRKCKQLIDWKKGE